MIHDIHPPHIRSQHYDPIVVLARLHFESVEFASASKMVGKMGCQNDSARGVRGRLVLGV
jgi:hypothetical protein